MAFEHYWSKVIDFYETDMAEIVHFSNYPRYMESAEHDFFRSLGFSVHAKDDTSGWPRVSIGCDYFSPLRFEDQLLVHLMVLKLSRSSVKYGFRLYQNNQETRVLAAVGQITAVHTKPNADGRMKAVPIPEKYLAAIEQAPTELAEAFMTTPRDKR